jgi:hypothetical protein
MKELIMMYFFNRRPIVEPKPIVSQTQIDKTGMYSKEWATQMVNAARHCVPLTEKEKKEIVDSQWVKNKNGTMTFVPVGNGSLDGAVKCTPLTEKEKLAKLKELGF